MKSNRKSKTSSTHVRLCRFKLNLKKKTTYNLFKQLIIKIKKFKSDKKNERVCWLLHVLFVFIVVLVTPPTLSSSMLFVMTSGCCCLFWFSWLVDFLYSFAWNYSFVFIYISNIWPHVCDQINAVCIPCNRNQMHRNKLNLIENKHDWSVLLENVKVRIMVWEK